jgi:hypothetical protein
MECNVQRMRNTIHRKRKTGMRGEGMSDELAILVSTFILVYNWAYFRIENRLEAMT